MNEHPTLIATGGSTPAGERLLGAMAESVTGGKRPNTLNAMGDPIQLQMFKGFGLQELLAVKV